MPKKPRKREEDYQQIARRILDTVAPDAEGKKKGRKAGNKPKRPAK